MNLTRYLYTGPQSSVCLRVGATAELLDVQLLPNQPVGLPANHEYTLVLLALKHLALIPMEIAVEPEPIPPVVEKKGAKSNGR